jgi:DNA gyrase/topoisomerase IV subunit A
MVTIEKIEAWLKEVEARPESAALILKYIADRLFDLSARNEELQAENIALISGKRVEEYEKEIAHLKYQLDLLKRNLGDNESVAAELFARLTRPVGTSLLVYNARGRVTRFEIGNEILAESTSLGQIEGDATGGSESPRLLALSSRGDVLLLFSSGRVSICPVEKIPVTEMGGTWQWSKSALPDEPRGGELLVSMLPLSQLPLADFFIQVSRRGCIKKTMASMSQTILANHFIGKSVVQKADQPFEIALCNKQERLVLLTREGRILGLDVDSLSYSTEERIKLSGTDHAVAACLLHADDTLMVLTQTGKVLQRTGKDIELAQSGLAKGQVLISPSRLDQGVRLIGAAPVCSSDRVAVLQTDGRLTVHLAADLSGSGAVRNESELLAFTTFAVTENRAPIP